MKPVKVLNLYAGLGGNRLKWKNVEVTAVEIDPKIAEVYSRLFPLDKVVIGDAHQFLADHYKEFQIIWTSRPCQSHSGMMIATKHEKKTFPDLALYEEIIFLQTFAKGILWIAENVVPYYKPLIPYTQKIGRHIFWANFFFDENGVTVPELQGKNGESFINLDNTEGKLALMDWLGIHFEENIYYAGNHCPAQVLRNCVHPLIGEHVFNAAVRRLKSKSGVPVIGQQIHFLEE